MQRQPARSRILLALTLVAVAAGGCDQRPVVQSPAPAPAVAPVAPAPAPAPAPVPPQTQAPAPSAPAGPSLEVQSHIRQAFSYLSTAKAAREVAIRQENIENALREFDLAVKKDPGYAEAYSNRAAAYMLQQKFNKAEEDLRKARELNPDSPSVRYNFASLHSLRGNVDLALDEIDAALSKGFTDYDALRDDPDLANLRRHPEFRKILEKHKVFIMR